MPNIKSAKKRLRQNTTRREVNLPIQTRVKTTRRSFLEAVATGDETASKTAFSSFCSCLDKATKAGVIKKNTATRSKQRASERLRSLAASS